MGEVDDWGPYRLVVNDGTTAWVAERLGLLRRAEDGTVFAPDLLYLLMLVVAGSTLPRRPLRDAVLEIAERGPDAARAELTAHTLGAMP